MRQRMIEGGREAAKAGAQAPEPSGEQPAARPAVGGRFRSPTIGSGDGLQWVKRGKLAARLIYPRQTQRLGNQGLGPRSRPLPT